MSRAVRGRVSGAFAGIAIVVLAGCSSVQQEADQEAVRIADHVIPKKLETLSSVSKPPEDRAADVMVRLAEPDPSVLSGQRATTLAVRGRDGTAIRVDVYSRWESGSFFPPDRGEAAWGRACRTYVVAERVTSTPMACPEATLEAP